MALRTTMTRTMTSLALFSKLSRVFSPPRLHSLMPCSAPCNRFATTFPVRGITMPVGATTVTATSTIPRQRTVGWWLLGTSSMVFGTVIIGGLTRLTESGLSIVDWRPITGSIPPLNEADWQIEFDKYRQSPEYKINNTGMTVDDFKKIFWMEWGHRQLGRTIGLVFLLPATFFIARGWVTRPMAYRLTGIGALIGLQGLIGWLMVKSGLDDRIVQEQEVPRVSHYRLATHLGTAFIIYIAGLWNALALLQKPLEQKTVQLLQSAAVVPIRRYALATTGLVFITAMSGALVAGLDAGLVYNEFPLMGNRWIPSDLLAQQPWWRNFFENPTTVQFDHRYLGLSTATAVSALFLYSRRVPLPPISRMAMNSVMAMVAIQVSLGIATLLTYVPISLASAHQAGSITLLTFAVWLLHSLRVVPK